MLLRNISLVHANGSEEERLVPDEGIASVLSQANDRLGAEFFKTPRDIIRSFVGLLNVIEQNPGKTWQDILGASSQAIFKKPEKPQSIEEEIETATSAPEGDDDLTTFKL